MQTFRIMIVDDDFTYRYAIKSLINWDNGSLVLSGEAINGMHALQMLEEVNPDIILTDISMPEMDGIEFIKEVKKLKPSIKFIVLSSYDDFVFVKEALKYGAEDYILKHEMDPLELDNLLLRTKNKISEENEKLIKDTYVKDHFSSMIDKFLEKLLIGEIADPETIQNNIKVLKLPIEANHLVIILVEVDFSDVKGSLGKNSEVMQAIANLIERIGKGVFLHLSSNLYCTIFSFSTIKSEAKIYNEIFEYARLMMDEIHKLTPVAVTIGVSNLCNKIENISQFFKQSQIALLAKVYDGKGKIYQYSQVSLNIEDDCITNKTFLSEFRNILNQGMSEYHKLNDIMDGYFENLYRKRPSDVILKKDLFELLIQFYSFIQNTGIPLENIIGSSGLPINFIENLESLEEIKSFFKECILRLENELSKKVSNVQGSHRKEIYKIKEYIGKNYTKDISLNQISDELELSPNYLCNMFKKETGMRITEYINKIRIDEAKKLLLSSNLKVYEVADKVGFSSNSYFCSVFKDVTGVKVSDFRNS